MTRVPDNGQFARPRISCPRQALKRILIVLSILYSALLTPDSASAFHFKKGAKALPPTEVASARAWADYDNDGDWDLAACGVDTDIPGYDGNCFGIYRKDGGIYTLVAAPLGVDAILSSCSIQWGDFNNDGKIDLAVAGFETRPNDTSAPGRFLIVKNLGNDSFEIASEPLGQNPAFDDSKGKIQWFDFDNDGDLDIVTSGFYSSSAQIFGNDGSGMFSPLPNPSPQNLPAGF